MNKIKPNIFIATININGLSYLAIGALKNLSIYIYTYMHSGYKRYI